MQPGLQQRSAALAAHRCVRSVCGSFRMTPLCLWQTSRNCSRPAPQRISRPACGAGGQGERGLSGPRTTRARPILGTPLCPRDFAEFHTPTIPPGKQRGEHTGAHQGPCPASQPAQQPRKRLPRRRPGPRAGRSSPRRGKPVASPPTEPRARRWPWPRGVFLRERRTPRPRPARAKQPSRPRARQPAKPRGRPPPPEMWYRAKPQRDNQLG